MTRGKRTCKILKEIRQEIADKNEIAYTSSECHFEGECQGTCPKCEAELKYIENELHKRTRLGKTATIAGISLGIAGTFSACNSPQQNNNQPVSEKETINTADFIIPEFSGTPKSTLELVGYTITPPIVGDVEVIEYTKGEIDLIDTVELLPFGQVNPFIDTTKKTCTDEPEWMGMIVETQPEFIGGEEARLKFIKENLQFPQIFREGAVEVKVIVNFVVETDGSLTNFKILRGVMPLLDEEALRVAKLMPKWKPAEQRGKPVRASYNMPIIFSLE